MIGEHFRPALRNQLGLILHILAATGNKQERAAARRNQAFAHPALRGEVTLTPDP
jgi:hypothetical protein